MKYRAEIDGLRAIAVLPVILFHAGLAVFSGGYVGVDVFFVISGYLITFIILAELKQGKFTISNFYERRARRILPALFTVMLVSIPLAIKWLLPSDLRDYAQSLVAVSTFSSNFLFWLESSYWGVASELKPLIHTWSLAVEEQYYVIFPLFLMLLWRMNKNWILSALLILFMSSLALAQISTYGEPEANFYLLPTRMWELAVGAVIAYLIINDDKYHVSVLFNPTIQSILALIGLFMIVSAVFVFDSDTPHPGLVTLMPTLGTGLIIMFSSPANSVGRVLGSKPLVQIGLISYSTYLWHQLFFAIARHYSVNEPSHFIFGILTLLTFVMAYLTYRFIETPFRNRDFISRNKIFLFSLLGTIFFIVAGTFLYFKSNQISLIKTPGYMERNSILHKTYRDRGVAIRANHCHHTNRGKFKDVKEFLENWSCIGDSEKPDWADNMALYGDSHGADKGLMLRSQGIDFLQAGGSGCSLMSSRGARCSQLLKFFHEKAEENNIETVLIANRFNEKELEPDYLQKLLNDWSSRYKKVYFFSPMIEFHFWQKKYLVHDLIEFEPNYSSHDQFFKTLDEINVPENVHIINTGELFCEDITNCSGVSKDGNLLLSNATHISLSGAELAGRKLIKILSGDDTQKNND